MGCMAGGALGRAGGGGSPAAPAAVGRLVETAAGTRAGSVVGVLAPAASAGASPELLGLADARAAAVVERATPAVGRLLARGTPASLLGGAGAGLLRGAPVLGASPRARPAGRVLAP